MDLHLANQKQREIKGCTFALVEFKKTEILFSNRLNPAYAVFFSYSLFPDSSRILY
jgi:hypothetical protein